MSVLILGSSRNVSYAAFSRWQSENKNIVLLLLTIAFTMNFDWFLLFCCNKWAFLAKCVHFVPYSMDSSDSVMKRWTVTLLRWAAILNGRELMHTEKQGSGLSWHILLDMVVWEWWSIGKCDSTGWTPSLQQTRTKEHSDHKICFSWLCTKRKFARIYWNNTDGIASGGSNIINKNSGGLNRNSSVVVQS
jgi:hypothetical protein